MSSPPFETTAESARLDHLLSALASDPRRRVLAHVQNTNEETVSLESLAEHVAATQDAGTLEQARIHLHHIHLPALAAVNLLDYDTDTRTIRYGGWPDEVDVEDFSQYLTSGANAR